MKRIITGLLFLLALSGCENGSGPATYPVVYVSTEYRVTSGVKLYSRGGQILDESVIERYLEQFRLHPFMPVADTVYPSRYNDSVIYLSPDTVRFTLAIFWDKKRPRQVGGYTFYYMYDTLVGIPNLPQDNDMKDILNNIGVFKPYYAEFGGVDPAFYYVYEAYVARAGSQELVMPELDILISRYRDGYNDCITKWDYNNAFDPTVIQLLEEKDTLAIQESETLYVRISE